MGGGGVNQPECAGGREAEWVDGLWRRTTDSVASKLNFYVPSSGLDVWENINYLFKHGKTVFYGEIMPHFRL
jgi:hypothetical protein